MKRSVFLLLLVFLLALGMISCSDDSDNNVVTGDISNNKGSSNWADLWNDSQSNSTSANSTSNTISTADDESSKPENSPHIFVESIEPFCDGLAELYYYVGEDKTLNHGVVNTKGEIVYHIQPSWDHQLQLYTVGNGVVYLYEKDYKNNIRSEKYVVIDETGKVIIESGNDTFTEILDAGDGMIFVYKHTASISSEKHEYGILNYKGEWISPLTERETALSGVSYLGCNIFKISVPYDREGNGGDYLYDVLNKKSAVPAGDSWANTTFENGVICSSAIYPRQCFALHTDLTIEIIPNYEEPGKSLSYGRIINKQGEYIEIYDIATKKTVIFDDFKTSLVNSIQFVEDCALVIIKGVDENFYFTVIDSNAEMRFDPICGKPTGGINDGRIEYSTLDENGNYIFKIIRVDGTPVLEYITMLKFYNGVATYKTPEGDYCFVNDKGEIIVDSFHEVSVD